MRPLTLIIRPALGLVLLTTLLTPVSLAQIYEYDLPKTQKSAVTAPPANTPTNTTKEATTPATSRTTIPKPGNSADPEPINPSAATIPQGQAPSNKPASNSNNNNVFEDMFYSVNKPATQQPASPSDTEAKPAKTATDNAPSRPARLKKQSWRAMNLGDKQEEAIKLEIQRLKQEREFDQQQISKNNEALKQVSDELDNLQTRRQALLDQLTSLAGKTPTGSKREKHSK